MFRKAWGGGAVTDRPVKAGCCVDRWACLCFVPRGWGRPAGQSLPGSLVSAVTTMGSGGAILSALGGPEAFHHGSSHISTVLLSRFLVSSGHLQPAKWKIPETNSS